VNIDPNDWTAPAMGAVSYENGYYGIPFDLHAMKDYHKGAV